jgi:hypothetical protein
MPNWLKAFGFTIVPAVLAYGFLVLFVEPHQSESLKTILGYRLTIVGFFVTVVGLAVAIWQSLKAVTAAEAAQISVNNLRLQLGSFDLMGTVGHAQATILEGLSHVGAGRWEATLGSFNRLQTSLSQLMAVPKSLENSQLDEAKDLKAKLSDSCLALGTAIREGQENLEITLLEKNLTDLEHFLILLSATLKERINV